MNNDKLTIGRYLIIKTIGKGGMGEVLLAFDPICKRNVALKKIRPELMNNEMIKNRFLKEAKIAGRLTHPSIISIFSIHTDENGIYYTMPYVEGKMLKELLDEAKEEISIQNTKGSIPYLIRVFLSVCEAVAYTHSKKILHRDLKPNNIIIGKYGEVLILDWGIADFMDSKDKDSSSYPSDEESVEITKPGKLAGTISFMAPERAFGEEASIQTEIYSLGVILYQILTLASPFQRRNLAHFKKYAKSEKIIDPIEKAPYRNIPRQLSEICMKCLNFAKEKRYQQVEDLISDLINYIEGRPEWLLLTQLDINNKNDWAIDENIFLPKYTAITSNNDLAQWVSLMLAKKSVSGNIKIQTDICFNDSSLGLGFLLALPEPLTKFAIEEGYLLWVGLHKYPYTQLIRSNALVMEVKELDLKPHEWYQLEIEKDESVFRFFLNKKLILTYVSHIPLAGTHIGLIYKDVDFTLKNLKVYSASHNVMVNCLAVPDAFLAKKDFDTAYNEYIRISQSFPGRMEGFLALFRAGITLLEKAKTKNDKALFQRALDEFEALHNTFGSPLEYLGKSHVYAALLEFEEEAKCLELAIRKFEKHPLLPMLKEHLFYRIHASSLQDREAAYRLLLLTILHLPSLKEKPDIQILISNLQKDWEELYFMIPHEENFSIELAFRLGRKHALIEILKELFKEKEKNSILIKNALFSLLELGSLEELANILENENYPLFSLALKSHGYSKEPADKKIKKKDLLKVSLFAIAPLKFTKEHARIILHILKYALDNKQSELVLEYLKKIKDHNFPKEFKLALDAVEIHALLLAKEYNLAKKIFDEYSQEELNNDSSPLHSLYGTWLYVKKGPNKAMIHFSTVLETSHPKTTTLLSHYLTEKIEKWFKHAFFFEKKELYRQLALFYACKEDVKKESYFFDLSLQNMNTMEKKLI